MQSWFDQVRNIATHANCDEKASAVVNYTSTSIASVVEDIVTVSEDSDKPALITSVPSSSTMVVNQIAHFDSILDDLILIEGSELDR